MNTPAELASRFPLVKSVSFQPGSGGLTKLLIKGPLADAEIYLHGAHVTHYQPKGQQPVLFMSSESLFTADKPIRGGVPMIFPWFGPRAGEPSAPAHGFARTLTWDVRQIMQADEQVLVSLGLQSSDATRRWLPNDFDLTYTVLVGTTLEMTLEVHNTSPLPLSFEEALHTYFVVGDVRQVSIDGLSGRTFIDKTAAGQRKQQTGPIRIERETDRVYLNTFDTVTVDDPSLSRRIIISKQGSDTTVVWNPWIDKAKAMSDFGDDEWPHMLCIETANAAANAKTIQPTARQTMKAMIRCER
jgi:glucose-6-phosphate 1-epimerase